MRLYYLLPTIMRLKSEQVTPDSGGESVLEKIVYALEEETDVLESQIGGITDLPNTNECPAEYLPLLADLVGIEYEGAWPEEKKRLWVKAADLLWHIKGMYSSWIAYLNTHGYQGYFPWELWKAEIYEDFDYALYPDYEYRYKAARVDIRKNETDPSPNHGIYVDDTVEPIRPVHVLLRRPGEYRLDEEEALEAPLDVDYDGSLLGDFSTNAVIEDSAPGFDDGGVDVTGPFTTDPDPACSSAGLQVYSYCFNTTCQLACQGTCTSSCETDCEYGACEFDCQTFCMQNGQSICDYTCQSSCEGICQTSCTTECETGCQTACQHPSCTVSCETACEGANCESVIEAFVDDIGDY